WNSIASKPTPKKGQSRMADRTCSKCSAPMEVGFLRYRVGTGSFPAQWIAGRPEPSQWGGVKVRKKPRYQVSVFRCGKCGYLEQYATLELPPAGILSTD